jgi:transposase
MRKHGELTLYLPIEEVERRFRTCRDARVKSRWQAIWLRMRGKPTTDISEIISCKPDWVRQLVRRSYALGPDGMKDGRESNGRKPLLSTDLQILLIRALMGPAPDGGLWNGKKVAQWISGHVGRVVPRTRGWIYLRELGFTSQTPRPRHRKEDKIAQEQYKKTARTLFRY